MRLNDQDHQDEHHPAALAAGPAIMVAAIMVIGIFATFLITSLESLRPKVGDIVVYRPHSQQQDIWQLEVTSADGQVSCVMDPAIMSQHGGSLMVEGRNDSDRDRQYRLHWAGAHTANGRGDCAGAADLAVSRTDLQKLANAAGGFGINAGPHLR